jgi:hypothetical protein
MARRRPCLSARERVRLALRGEQADRVPFTVYWLMLPRGGVERALRNAGAALVERVPLFRLGHPGFEVVERQYEQEGVAYLRRELRELQGPGGCLHATYRRESGYGTSWWQLEPFVKQSSDYDLLERYLEARTYHPAYEAFAMAERAYGEDGYVVGNTEYSPLNLLLHEFLGMAGFCLQLADRPERLLRLYELLREKQRRMFEICAASPAELVLYDGNISQEVFGEERFRRWFRPCHDEFAAAMHGSGKLAGCHLDARMAGLARAVGESGLDVIEAFTPAPTCDMTVADARRAWPGKVLWANFPSSVHLEGEGRIRQQLGRILRDAAPGDRFLVGITEDVPWPHWPGSLRAICDGLRRLGALPLAISREDA